MASDTQEDRVAGSRIVNLLLDGDEAAELIALLDAAIADLSPEIADKDNPQYRTMLRARRDLLRTIRGKLSGPSATGT